MLILFFILHNEVSFCQNRFQGEYQGVENSAGKEQKFLKIHYRKRGEILFRYDGITTDYRTNAIYGRLVACDKPGCMRYIPDDTILGCTLDFSINKEILKVIPPNGCPLGNGAVPYGMYKRVKRSNPPFFIDRASQKVYFDSLLPKDYTEP